MTEVELIEAIAKKTRELDELHVQLAELRYGAKESKQVFLDECSG